MKPIVSEHRQWTRDHCLQDLQPRLAATPPPYRAVSFDFFDTLVCRLCAEPDDLFIEVGRRLARAGLLRRPLSPGEFRAARIAADERARDTALQQRKSPEVRLDEIYAELGAVVTDIAAARAVEFEVERAFCYVNPATASLVRYLHDIGMTIAILSDTYFVRAELERLLRDGGLDPSLFTAIIASSESGKAKWSGTLYHELFKRLDLHPGELLHIGDNPHADVKVPAQFGVQAHHYYRTNAYQNAVFTSEADLRGMGPKPSAALHSLRTLAARQAGPLDDAARDGAFVFGPVLTRYAEWCVERFRAAGVRTVLALMREGEVLGELVSQAAAEARVDLNVVPCFTSRLATARAALPEITPARAAELLEGSAYLTAQAVLDILGVGEEASRFLDAEARSKPLAGAEGVAGLLNLLFRLPKIRDLLEARRAASHSLAFEYFQELIGQEEVVGIIDLGWSGSIQRNISRILERGGRQVRTIGCYLACTRRAGRLALRGDEAHGYFETEWASNATLPETAITATIGSTDGYARDRSGTVIPVLGPYESTPAERRLKQSIRNGIAVFQRLWSAYRATRPAGAITAEMMEDIDRHSPAILRRLMDYPTKPEADRLGELSHDENYFGKTHSAPLCDKDAPARLRREGVANLFQAARSYWPQGVIARAHPRLISGLRAAWQDPIALGRLGTWHGVALHDPGLTDEELSSLGALLHSFASAQVIFAGPMAPVLEEVLHYLWSHESTPSRDPSRPRLIVAGEIDEKLVSPAFKARCAAVPGDPAHPATLRSMRSHLVAGQSSALVLSHEVTPAVARLLMNGVGPFLGPEGLVLIPCGRFDRHTPGEEVPLHDCLEDWLEESGFALGFRRWSPPGPAAQPHLANWAVLRRDPEAVAWNRQWTFDVADLPPGGDCPPLLQRPA